MRVQHGVQQLNSTRISPGRASCSWLNTPCQAQRCSPSSSQRQSYHYSNSSSFSSRCRESPPTAGALVSHSRRSPLGRLTADTGPDFTTGPAFTSRRAVAGGGPPARRVAMASLIGAAFQGMSEEVAAAHGFRGKAGRLCAVGGTLLSEVAAIIGLAPFGARSMLMYRSIPTITAAPGDLLPGTSSHAQRDPPPGTSGGRPNPLGVLLQRDISYGPGAANVLDVYVPVAAYSAAAAEAAAEAGRPARAAQHIGTAASTSGAPSAERLAPVVCFVHGGIWSSGDRWHYGPMGQRLAQEGCVVVVLTHTLYPKALVEAMVGEVSAALSWTLDNVRRYGGDPAQVSFVGHSSGGHLAAMALLQRAMVGQAGSQVGQAGQAGQPGRAALAEGGRTHSAAAAATADGSAAGQVIGSAPPQSPLLPPPPPMPCTAPETDDRMPLRFVAMAAVFDIAKHYDFETLRGVAQISMMRRAIGGFTMFEYLSPSVILAAAADAAAPAAAPATATSWSRSSSAPGPSSSVGFSGTAVDWADSTAVPPTTAATAAAAAASATAVRPSNVPTSRLQRQRYFESFPLEGEAIPIRAGLQKPQGQAGRYVDYPASFMPPFTLDAAANLPPCFLMSSCNDHMIPWHESAQMATSLTRCGVPNKHLIYNHAAHGEYIMAWYPRPQNTGGNVAAAVASAATAMPLQDGDDATADQAAVVGQLCLEGLPSCARDLLRIVTGVAQPPQIRPMSRM